MIWCLRVQCLYERRAEAAVEAEDAALAVKCLQRLRCGRAVPILPHGNTCCCQRSRLGGPMRDALVHA